MFKVNAENPITKPEIEIQINMPYATRHAQLSQVNLQGVNERYLWKGTLKRGENRLIIDVGATPSGERMLCFEDKENGYQTCIFLVFLR
jgi:hypothetical protein